MVPIIKSGNKVTISPIKDRSKIKKKDIVFCKLKDEYYIHTVINIQNGEFQIGDNHGNINGWVKESQLLGLVTKVEK